LREAERIQKEEQERHERKEELNKRMGLSDDGYTSLALLSKKNEGKSVDKSRPRLRGIKLFQDIMRRHRVKFQTIAMFSKLARDYKLRYNSLMDKLRISELKEQRACVLEAEPPGDDRRTSKKLLSRPSRALQQSA
jgi:hypothetical protein